MSTDRSIIWFIIFQLFEKRLLHMHVNAIPLDNEHYKYIVEIWIVKVSLSHFLMMDSISKIWYEHITCEVENSSN